ncbi:sensor histidine kinase [Chelativorans sp. AA-79]|uniref:sensor histidine kinase n=1 Tax=Chelativorans sp. AA-79 TaxID=3028735 RepID=UPI0023F880E4|nr:sensor histidine kinase [Chelativorans sp. AA-79]WEX09425.1 sensor histidine kinase [Chelativorans sp. AA-79]
MAIEAQDKRTSAGQAKAGRSTPWLLGRLAVPLRRVLGHYMFSSLTRRILILNFTAIGVLVVGVLYINQFRDALVEAQIESLRTQGRIIAGAIAASATVETDAILIDPEKLLEMQAGEQLPPGSDQLESLEFPINPEKVAHLLRRLINPDRTRARIYDRDANLVLDSRQLYSILRYQLPGVDGEEKSFFEKLTERIGAMFQANDLPIDREQPGGSGVAYEEVMSALKGGEPEAVRRRSPEGEYIISVAVPIQRYRAVVGVLQLSTQGDIDRIIAEERRAVLRVFAVAAVVTAILSLLLASTIANPLRRLSAAAIRVRRGAGTREQIPDFSHRQDEIGNLSIALRDMTKALYARIDAIESFAADVAHELKNPLTSLGSAVETLPLAKDQRSRDRLMEIIQHDVRRLDRLITDISDASRLDAEFAREDSEPIDLQRFLRDLVAGARDMGGKKKQVDIEFKTEGKTGQNFIVEGHDLRLGQVVTNLIENARSFVPEEGGRITLTLSRSQHRIILTVDDNGPGIRADNIERIFERFYTDRPVGEAFGQNSGLGLSISRQIIEAHGGTLTAENVPGSKPGEVRGARFVISLPAEG